MTRYLLSICIICVHSYTWPACEIPVANDNSLYSAQTNIQEDLCNIFLQAVADRNIDLITEILTYDPQVIHIHDQDGLYPIHIAARAGHCDVIQLLIDHGADPNHIAPITREDFTKTEQEVFGSELETAPLAFAVKHGHLHAAQTLLSNGAYADPKDEEADIASPLLEAITQNDIELVHVLMEYGANPDNPGLLISAQLGQLEIMTYLISAGAPFKVTTFNKPSLLHAAAKGKQQEVTQWLIQNGYEPKTESEDGETPLFYAVELEPCDIQEEYEQEQYNAYRITQCLLEHGVDPNRHSHTSGKTALHRAVALGDAHLVRLVLTYGACPHPADRVGSTPLHTTAEYPDVHEATTKAKLLLQAGADVDARNADGITPLHMAALTGKKALVRLLLDHHANPMITTLQPTRDAPGYTTPDEIARKQGHTEIAALLEQQKRTQAVDNEHQKRRRTYRRHT